MLNFYRDGDEGVHRTWRAGGGEVPAMWPRVKELRKGGNRRNRVKKIENMVFAENMVGFGCLQPVSYIKPNPNPRFFFFLLCEKVAQMPLLT